MRISDWSSDVCSSDLSGRDDLVVLATALDVEQPLDRPSAAADVAHRRDPVGEPQLQHIFGGNVLAVLQAVQVDVGVDETGEDVMAGEVDFIVSRRGPAVLVCGAGCSERLALGDAIAREEDRKRTRLNYSHSCANHMATYA